MPCSTTRIAAISAALWAPSASTIPRPAASWLARLLTLLAVMGPGLIVMVGDNDVGGVSTYAQAGQNYGTGLLWTLLLLIPVLIVNQEMVVRLGLVTGVGHARLIIERFGRFWGAFSVGDLFLLNFLTIITEFIGVSLAMQYFGVSPYISVPVAAARAHRHHSDGQLPALGARHVSLRGGQLPGHPAGAAQPSAAGAGRARLPCAAAAGRGQLDHPAADHRHRGHHGGAVAALLPAIQRDRQAAHAALDGLRAGRYRDRRVRGHSGRGRADDRHSVCLRGHQAVRAVWRCWDGGGAARADGRAGLGRRLSPSCLLNAGIIGASAVTLASSYAFGDVFGVKHSLHRYCDGGRGFYLSYSVQVAVAAGIVLIPNAPLGLIVTAVQALAGVLLPSATVFLLLLCNDQAVLGPWVNKPWLNVVASVIVGILVMLSLILAATTLFPTWDVTRARLGSERCSFSGSGRHGATLPAQPGARARSATAQEPVPVQDA